MAHQLEETIVERYRIVEFLGEGLGGKTYRAWDLATKKYVALKCLSLQEMGNWKTMELFEREASILAKLKHSAIPEYLNYFQLDRPDEKQWYLVQKYISGQSLNTLVENGWRTTEAEAIDLAIQVLEVLIYLHSLNPPVIHRDIKPQNIIRQPDGKIYLVDFGAVTEIYRHTQISGSTVVGTYGYMPPEQFRGQVVPATDLYALGATLVYLLTHLSPLELPQEKLKLNFRSFVNISQHSTDWLDVMLEPIVEDRFESASQALKVLKGELKFGRQHSSLRQPAHSKISLTKTRTKLNATIPHNKEPEELNSLVIIFYVTVFLGILLLSPSSELSIITELKLRGILALPLCIADLYFLFDYLYSNFGKTNLEADSKCFKLIYSLFGMRRQIAIETADIIEAKLSHSFVRGDTQHISSSVVSSCFIVEGTKNHKFGRHTKRVEKEWLINEINDFLNKQFDRNVEEEENS